MAIREAERVRATLSSSDFTERFIRASKPCVIEGAQNGWSAAVRWQPDALLASHGAVEWRIGDRPDHTVILNAYLSTPTLPPLPLPSGTAADSPARLAALRRLALGASDAAAAESDVPPRPYIFDGFMPHVLAADYASPAAVGAGCLFCADASPPPHRWLLIGQPLTGTPLHVDPLATCAWNALVVGRKLWALYPPAPANEATSAPAEALLARSVTLPPAAWFADVLPTTLAADWAGPAPMIVDQRAGETVFVPEGWRHAVA